MVMEYSNKVGSLDVFVNKLGDIVIVDTNNEYAFSGIAFDECMAEKLCKTIMKVANEIRGN